MAGARGERKGGRYEQDPRFVGAHLGRLRHRPHHQDGAQPLVWADGGGRRGAWAGASPRLHLRRNGGTAPIRGEKVVVVQAGEGKDGYWRFFPPPPLLEQEFRVYPDGNIYLAVWGKRHRCQVLFLLQTALRHGKPLRIAAGGLSGRLMRAVFLPTVEGLVGLDCPTQ